MEWGRAQPSLAPRGAMEAQGPASCMRLAVAIYMAAFSQSRGRPGSVHGTKPTCLWGWRTHLPPVSAGKPRAGWGLNCWHVAGPETCRGALTVSQCRALRSCNSTGVEVKPGEGCQIRSQKIQNMAGKNWLSKKKRGGAKLLSKKKNAPKSHCAFKSTCSPHPHQMQQGKRPSLSMAGIFWVFYRTEATDTRLSGPIPDTWQP